MNLRTAAAAVIIGSALIAWAAQASTPSGPSIAAITTSTTTTATTPDITTNAAGQHVWHYTMPASATATDCTVWLEDHYAYIEFSAASLDVRPACASWVQSSAAGGELWMQGMLPATTSNETTICTLTDGRGARAVVYDEEGDLYGQQACTRLISGTWSEAYPAAAAFSG